MFTDEASQLRYRLIVGIETHVQVLSATKAFCGCANSYGGIPNTRTCPVCLALPGAMPQVNVRLFEAAVLTGLALGCNIAPECGFVRKSYSYPDLPKGYQITQMQQICTGGFVEIGVNGEHKKIPLVGLHMEEDVGKSLSIADETETCDYYDYNRAGTPLLEIVSSPSLHSAEEASAYAGAIREVVRFLGVSDGEMESGSLRCDANINVEIHHEGKTYVTPIAEVKNMNSFRSIRRAINYEAARQIALWRENGVVLGDAAGVKTTRRWDDDADMSVFMRTKGPLDDYRFVAEPDLPTTIITPDFIARLTPQVGRTPMAIRKQLQTTYGLNDEDALTLTSSKALALYYEEAALGAKNAKKVANRLLSELLATLKEQNISIEQSPVSAAHLRELCDLVEEGAINSKQSKTVFAEMVATQANPVNVVKKLGLEQIKDEAVIEPMVVAILQANAKAVGDYHQGRDHALKFLMGQLMKQCGGTVNPDIAMALFITQLNEHFKP